MPDLNDYHAFTSTSSGRSNGDRSNSSSGGEGGNEGCAGTFVWIFAIVSLFWNRCKTNWINLRPYSAAFAEIGPFIYLRSLLITDLKNCRIKM